MTVQKNQFETRPVPSIGVGGILFNKNQQVLLIKRNQAPARGLWSIPGGKLESGETLIEACRREFYEETNLTVEVKQLVAVVERQIEGFHYVITDFYVQLLDEEKSVLIAQSDVDDAHWVSLDALSHYPLVGGLAEIITHVYTWLDQPSMAGLQNRDTKGLDFVLEAKNDRQLRTFPMLDEESSQ